MREYGVDGFKFDAGDGSFYRDDDQTYGHVSAAEQTELWAQLGAAYPYNEFRACFKAAGLPWCSGWRTNTTSGRATG